MAKYCEQCHDGEGHSIYPYYGVAPHNCGWRLGHPEIGTSQQLPEFMWPENFKPDTAADVSAGEYPGSGTYTHCLNCGAGEQEDAAAFEKLNNPTAGAVPASES